MLKTKSTPCAGTTKKRESLANFCTYSIWLGMQGAKKRRGCNNLFASAEAFRQWILPQGIAQALWNEYVASGYQEHLTPSVSRIDPEGDYAPLNCQVLTQREARIKHNLNPNCGKRLEYTDLPRGVSQITKSKKPWYSVGGSFLATKLDFPLLLTNNLEEAIEYNTRKRTAIIFFLDQEGVLFPDSWR
jgi:hypothetical protein